MKASVWILGDQLIEQHPAITHAVKTFERESIIILMIESQNQFQRLPYHAKKLVLLKSAMRHYAKELEGKGYQVDYRSVTDTATALFQHCKDFFSQILVTMAASSFQGREFQAQLTSKLIIETEILPNTQFLTGQFDPFPDYEPGDQITQEKFYRKIRQHFNVLIEDHDSPMGGKWNYDKKNRKPLPQDKIPPKVIRFETDTLTQQVIQEVKDNWSFTGNLEGFDLAVTHEQAQQAADDFFENRLDKFGTYEDAMSKCQSILYHSKLSPYINLGLLQPLELARAAESHYHNRDLAINNVEGFIRQVIGWREYMYWQYHLLMPDLAGSNFWESDNQLPHFFWDADTQMNCLKHVLERLLDSGYAHHIERLMVLSNFCLLTGINPDEVYHWFNCMLIDAYEWVMVPNVYGMGLYADGGLISTKPYIASANYIHKMSDYCDNCHFDHGKRTGEQACPYNFLYWNFLISRQETLQKMPRMARMLYNLKYLDDAERKRVQESASQFLESLD